MQVISTFRYLAFLLDELADGTYQCVRGYDRCPMRLTLAKGRQRQSLPLGSGTLEIAIGNLATERKGIAWACGWAKRKRRLQCEMGVKIEHYYL